MNERSIPVRINKVAYEILREIRKKNKLFIMSEYLSNLVILNEILKLSDKINWKCM